MEGLDVKLVVVNKYSGKINERTREVKKKRLTLNIYERELMVPHEIEDNLFAVEQGIKEWKLKNKDLEKEKERLERETKNALKRKENEIEETVKNTEEKLREIQEKIKNSLSTFRM